MLVKEKKRVAWSLATGALCAVAILAWQYREAIVADRELPGLVERCKADATSVPPPNPFGEHLYVEIKNGKVSVACDPDILADATPIEFDHFGSNLTRLQRRIADARNAQRWEEAWLAAAIFAVFCLPLIWYFLLDRIREVSAAVSGKDK